MPSTSLTTFMLTDRFKVLPLTVFKLGASYYIGFPTASAFQPLRALPVRELVGYTRVGLARPTTFPQLGAPVRIQYPRICEAAPPYVFLAGRAL